MVHRFLVSCAYVCCLIVFASFVLFAGDQISGASKQQAAEIASGTPTRASSSGNEHHGQPRRFIDGAARVLTYPFHSLISSESQWAYHLFVLICGLAIYGLGLGYISRYTSGLP